MTEKKCSHEWAMADEPCFCGIDGSDCQKAHVSYYCSHCGQDKCVQDVIDKALAEQARRIKEELEKILSKAEAGENVKAFIGWQPFWKNIGEDKKGDLK